MAKDEVNLDDLKLVSIAEVARGPKPDARPTTPALEPSERDGLFLVIDKEKAKAGATYADCIIAVAIDLPTVKSIAAENQRYAVFVEYIPASRPQGRKRTG